MNPKEALVALENLEKSSGWQYLQSIMEQEVVSAAMSIADSSSMSLDEINFRRGSIWAAKSLLSLPDKLRLRLQNEVALAQDDKKAD